MVQVISDTIKGDRMGTVAFHAGASRVMMGQAGPELAKGDRLQASEKGWRAASHGVKAIAEGRGWEHKSHADLFRVVRRLTAEMERPEIRNLFDDANGLHINFYEGWLDDVAIAQNLASVRRLLAMLDEASR